MRKALAAGAAAAVLDLEDAVAPDRKDERGCISPACSRTCPTTAPRSTSGLTGRATTTTVTTSSAAVRRSSASSSRPPVQAPWWWASSSGASVHDSGCGAWPRRGSSSRRRVCWSSPPRRPGGWPWSRWPWGGCYLFGGASLTALIHAGVGDDLRGRVMAFWSMTFLGVRPLAGLVDGALADLVSARLATLLPAAVPAVAAVGVARPTHAASRSRPSSPRSLQ